MRVKDRMFRLPLLGIALLAVLFFGQGCETESDDIPTGPVMTGEQLVEDGWAELRAGNPDAALVLFNQAANADASNLEAYLGLGYAFAVAQQPIQARQNLENVVALGRVMVNSNELDPELADALYAEAFAGQASVELAEENYQEAIDQAQAAAALWEQSDTPRHRWMPEYDLAQVRVLEAEAWYGLERYDQTMLIVEDLTGDFIESSDAIVFAAAEPQTVRLLQNTANDGIAELRVTNVNLIYPSEVESGGVSFDVVDFAMTGNSLRFRGNPIPTSGQTYNVSYYYAVDFGAFLIDLRQALDELQ